MRGDRSAVTFPRPLDAGTAPLAVAATCPGLAGCPMPPINTPPPCGTDAAPVGFGDDFWAASWLSRLAMRPTRLPTNSRSSALSASMVAPRTSVAFNASSKLAFFCCSCATVYRSCAVISASPFSPWSSPVLFPLDWKRTTVSCESGSAVDSSSPAAACTCSFSLQEGGGDEVRLQDGERSTLDLGALLGDATSRVVVLPGAGLDGGSCFWTTSCFIMTWF
mmetsp:Transcript_90050/g.232412  ORF Transcript_90050/g.232412 Transcript_90050/m.232412 type:complete len:221 (-) Transcript_90050:841-1503(-)